MTNAGAISPPAAPGLTPVTGRVGRVGSTAGPSDRPGRVIGVDVARGIALIGMMAAHVFDILDPRGDPTVATSLAAGRSATTFALVAGVSLAFLSGGQRPVQGRTRTAAAAGIAMRALLIGAIGLALGHLIGATEIEVILPYYAVFFLLAIPLLGLRPRTLALLAAALIAVAPVMIFAVVNVAGRSLRGPDNPAFDTLVDDPAGLIVGLLFTGAYPALAYLAYLCAGLALGRLDLSSRRVATWLLGGGLGLAFTAQLVSAVLLYPLGGLRQLQSADPASSASVLLWNPQQNSSWWYLALPSPHSTTPIDMVHTLGSAMAVLGAALLLCRVPVIAWLLRPLAAAGAMTLTLYCAHVLILAPGALSDSPATMYFLLVAAALAFGLAWQRWRGQGPLERLIAVAASKARKAVTSRADRVGSP